MKMPRLPYCTHRFTLTGFNPERFMNTMQRLAIPLVSVRRADIKTLCCQCYSADLSRVREIADEKGWRLTQIQPTGLSACAAWLKARPGIPIGALLTLALVMTLLQFVWRVEVHNAGAYSADIAAYLSKEGYRPGTQRSKLAVRELERKLTRRYPSIAWFHVYAYNVTLVVDVSQGVPMPALPTAAAGDVVAVRDGIVSTIQVFAGTPQVKAGDIVHKGQVLIRGLERSRDEQWKPIQARGVIMARCWRSQTVHMPMRDIKSEETGQYTAQTRVCTPWLCAPAQWQEPPYLASNSYLQSLPLVGCFFPIWLETRIQREVSMSYTLREAGAVKAEAAAAALRKLKTALYGYELIDKWADYCMIEGDTLAVTVTAEWLMDIGGVASP
ncbi:MAG: sporulation protein YqfD [Clostridia bacterium]